MTRNLGLAAMFVVGLVFGCFLGSHNATVAAQSDIPSAVTSTLDDVVDQLKELNKTAKSTDELLHSNNLRVVTVINPGR